MIRKFTRVVFIAVMPIGLITGCGTTEKAEAQEPKADYRDYSYGSAGILVSGKAKERQQYKIGYIDDNMLIGINENIEDRITLDNKDESGYIWKNRARIYY